MAKGTGITAELNSRHALPEGELVLRVGNGVHAVPYRHDEREHVPPDTAPHGILARAVDALGAACALYDGTGRCVHMTPRLRALLNGEPEAGALERAMAHLARRLGLPALRLHAGARSIHPSVVTGGMRTVRGRWQFEVTSIGVEAAGADATLVVRVTTDAEPLPSARELAERHGFTPREAEVARLIAQGLGTAGIAERLGLSPHTVRRHTERVFSKLGVHTRAEVAAAVVRGG